jgi:NADH:ubiquinone oxidoreductase subunit K
MTAVLLVAAAMFCAGVYGLVTQRHAIGILVSIELMVNAANINLVAFGYLRGGTFGQAMALFVLALTVAEVVIGLAILLLMHRTKGDIQVDLASELKQ